MATSTPSKASAAHPTPPTRRVVCSISAPLSEAQNGETLPGAHAYLYSGGGSLLGQGQIDAKGQARMEISVGTAPLALRLLVGPALPERNAGPDQLLRLGAPERHLRLDADITRLQAELLVPPEVWRLWLVNRCVVKGTLHQRVLRDGVGIDLPVCSAMVDIYEVDPLHVIVPRIPAELLARLRDLIVQPIPLPDPLPDPGPLESGPAAFSLWSYPGSVGGVLPVPLPLPLPATGAAPEAAALAPGALLQQAAADTGLRLAALGGSDLALRQALVAQPLLVRPLLCRLFPQLVTMQHIASTPTDDCGHFRTTIFKSIVNPDQPDLYFKARQRRFGYVDLTIHAPTPVACHTWWNYRCGSEVQLHTSHPLAVTCPPCPPVIAGDRWVLFTAIGRRSLGALHGVGTSIGPVSAANRGLTSAGEPWGGTLRPRLEFDHTLRGLGVSHYRLSWKRDGEPDSAYKPLGAVVGRHYAHVVAGELVLDAYPLGPTTVGSQGNLFEIPPDLPPKGQWSIADPVDDTASGLFNTVAADGTALLDGLVQLRVELFNTAGAAVDIGALGIRYVVPTSTELSGTIHTTEAAGLGLVAGNTLVVTLHVNNEPCSAAIAAPTIAATAADPCCGVLRYASRAASVQLGWTPSHPHAYAGYHYSVVRGVSTVVDLSGPVGAGSLAINRSVDVLLDENLPAGCTPGGCPVAGFSENLYVAASTTDGWSRQSQYDASAVRAFVLAQG